MAHPVDEPKARVGIALKSDRRLYVPVRGERALAKRMWKEGLLDPVPGYSAGYTLSDVGRRTLLSDK